MTTRRSLALLIAATAIYVAASVVGGDAALVVTDLLSLGALALAGRGVAMQPRSRRRPWVIIIAGITTWFVGDLIWDGSTLLTGSRPTISVADVLYLLGYPVLAAGLVSMIRLRAPADWRHGLLDAIGLAVAAALASWVFLVPANDPGSSAEHFLAIAYPLSDVVLLAALAWLLLAPGKRGVPSAMVFAGFVANMAIDVVMLAEAAANHPIGAWFDNAYPLTYLLIALASCHEGSAELTDRQPTADGRFQPARIVLLGIALFSGPIIGTFNGLTGAHRLLVLLTTAGIGTIVMVRFVAALRDAERVRAALSVVAGTDDLTGLDNRRQFLERGGRCLERIAHTNGFAGVLMLDIDHFKQINDTYGHGAGDAVLTEVSHRCIEAVRPDDLVGRLGGDEFAILLPGCDEVETRDIAERIRTHVVGAPFVLPRPGQSADYPAIAVTLSVGAAAGAFPTLSAALDAADGALYEAKRRGRNRMCVAGAFGRS